MRSWLTVSQSLTATSLPTQSLSLAMPGITILAIIVTRIDGALSYLEGSPWRAPAPDHAARGPDCRLRPRRRDAQPPRQNRRARAMPARARLGGGRARRGLSERRHSPGENRRRLCRVEERSRGRAGGRAPTRARARRRSVVAHCAAKGPRLGRRTGAPARRALLPRDAIRAGLSGAPARGR